MKFLLGVVAVLCCIVLSTFDAFLTSPLLNVAYWGIAVSVIYIILTIICKRESGSYR